MSSATPATIELQAASFSTGRAWLGRLLQLAPLLGATSALIDGVLNRTAVSGPTPWYPLGDARGLFLQCLSVMTLLAGSGYVALGRRRRFIGAWFLGISGFLLLQLSFAFATSRVEMSLGLFLVALSTAETVDLWLLGKRRDVDGWQPNAAEILATAFAILGCWFALLVLILMVLALVLVVSLSLGCRASYLNCI